MTEAERKAYELCYICNSKHWAVGSCSDCKTSWEHESLIILDMFMSLGVIVE